MAYLPPYIWNKSSLMSRFSQKSRKKTHWFLDAAKKHRDFLFEYQLYGSIPHHLTMVQGGITDMFVVKRYRQRKLINGRISKARLVMTKFPDMSNIIASHHQRECRTLFQQAVAFAKEVISNPDLKQQWSDYYRIELYKVYHRAVKQYILQASKGVQIPGELVAVKEKEIVIVEEPLKKLSYLVIVYKRTEPEQTVVEERRLRLAG
jgi:hypothetical protein